MEPWLAFNDVLAGAEEPEWEWYEHLKVLDLCGLQEAPQAPQEERRGSHRVEEEAGSGGARGVRVDGGRGGHGGCGESRKSEEALHAPSGRLRLQVARWKDGDTKVEARTGRTADAEGQVELWVH